MTATGKIESGHRIPSIDLARGLIMILMALDHVRIFFSNAQFNPVDPGQTNLLLFLMRWITHYCAPGFFLIAGVAVFLYLERCGSKREVAKFLISRGLWLIFLELTVIGFAWSFNPGWSWLGVIWSLGGSFLVMAALIFLPRPVILWGSTVIIFLHAIVGEPYLNSLQGPPESFMAIVYAGGPASLPILGTKGVLYSLFPWAAMMAFGFGLGSLFVAKPGQRFKSLTVLGAGMIAAFVLLRLTGIYGNPEVVFPGGWSGAFSVGNNISETVINFLNTQKYPPSPQFTLMTLGPLFLLLAYWTRFDNGLRRPGWLKSVEVIGNVPMFFYIQHIYLIHSASLLLSALTGQPKDNQFWDGTYPNIRPPDGYGYDELTVLIIWVLITAILYLACKWFQGYKRTHRQWWLRYL